MGAAESRELVFLLISVLFFLMVCLRWHGYLPAPLKEFDAEAEARAAELQRDVLSERELCQLAQSGYLVVASPSVADREYRVPARPGWVEVYESGYLAMRLCVEPRQPLPPADVVVLHKLLIEGDEKRYLSVANAVYVRPTSGPRRETGPP